MNKILAPDGIKLAACPAVKPLATVAFIAAVVQPPLLKVTLVVAISPPSARSITEVDDVVRPVGGVLTVTGKGILKIPIVPDAICPLN